MSKQQNEQNPLRKKAEAQLACTPQALAQARPAEEMLHELQLHQIELEMQNEELRRVQAVLEESRDRYVDLYELAPVGYLTLSDSGMIAEINLTGAALLGEERKLLARRRFASFVAATDHDRWYHFFTGMLQHNGQRSCELLMQRGDGSRFHAGVDCVCLAKGSAARSVGLTLTDISKRKRAEEELIKSSAEIEDLYNHAPCGYHSLDRDGIIRQINDTELAWLGYTRDEVVGKMKLSELMTPASQEIFRKDFPQFMQRGFVHDLEFDLTRKDGTVFTALVNATAIYDTSGNYTTSRSTLQDITKRKAAENALAKSEERARLAISASHLALWDYDLTTGNVYLSEGWSQFLGGEQHPTFTTIQELTKLVPAEEQRTVRTAILAAVKGQDSSSYQVTHRVRKPDGEYIWIMSKGYVTDRAPDGRALRMIGTNRVITERKKLEKEILERRNEMEEIQKLHVAAQTVAAIAHELNQPLLAIATYSEAALMLLKAGKPDIGKVRKAIESSERQAHRAGQAIRELLDFLNLKNFLTETVDLNQEILDIVDAARSEHEMQFHPALQLEQELPLVLVNRSHIQKVLLNLLKNGVEAMQEAGVPQPAITVTVRTIKDENLVEVTVTDFGPGFRKEDIRHLFEPFFTTKAKGIGMGLAISRSLIEANGGQLWVDPHEGPGATFHLTLPVAP